MRLTERGPSRAEVLLAEAGTVSQYKAKETIYSQGTAADSIFYIQEGMVMLTVHTKKRRPSVVAVLGAGEFFNEFCVLGHVHYRSTATALTSSSILAIKKEEMMRSLRGTNGISTLFRTALLHSVLRFREDLLDVHINSSEQRLARALLRLANLGAKSRRSVRIHRISQRVLAEMIGTTRSRVCFFMNRFNKQGFISDNGALEIHSSLRNVFLKD